MAPVRYDLANGGEPPAELSEHLDEVRTEPLIDDLSVVVEPEREQERRLDLSASGLLDEQPGPSWVPRTSMNTTARSSSATTQRTSPSKIGEGINKTQARAQDGRIGRVLTERGEVMAVHQAIDELQNV